MEETESQAPISLALSELAAIAAVDGEPTNINVSLSLAQVTVCLPGQEAFTKWCDYLGAVAFKQDAFGSITTIKWETVKGWEVILVSPTNE